MSEFLDETLVAEALAEAVHRAGPSVASEPVRVQGMISDSLGRNGRTRRSEIDAVVLAAKERVADDLITGQLQPSRAIDVLVSKGLDNDSARFSVDVWRYALGLLGEGAEAPTLTRSVETSTDRSEERFEALTVAPSQALGSSGRPGDSDSLVRAGSQSKEPDAVYPPPTGEPVESPRPESANRQRLIFSCVAVLAVAFAALIAMKLIGGGDSDEVSTGPEPHKTTQNVVVEFPAETLDIGKLERTWTVKGTRLESKLKFTNSTKAPTKGTHYEVVPKEVAKSASEISSATAFKVIKADPVIAWDLELKAEQTLTITYEAKVDPKTSSKDLEAWKTAQTSAAKKFSEERNAKPELKIATPPNQTINTAETTVSGTADPHSKITVAGKPAAVGPDGKWSQVVSGLTPGAHPIEVTATSPYGVVTKASITVTVSPATAPAPAVTTTAPTTTAAKRPVATKPPTYSAPPTTAAAPRATTPPPPPTTAAPKPISASISGPTIWYIPADPSLVCNYDLTLHTNGFTPKSITWSGGSFYNNKTTARFSTQGLHTGPATVTAKATAPDGRVVNATFNFTLLLGTPYAC